MGRAVNALTGLSTLSTVNNKVPNWKEAGALYGRRGWGPGKDPSVSKARRIFHAVGKRQHIGLDHRLDFT